MKTLEYQMPRACVFLETDPEKFLKKLNVEEKIELKQGFNEKKGDF